MRSITTINGSLLIALRNHLQKNYSKYTWHKICAKAGTKRLFYFKEDDYDVMEFQNLLKAASEIVELPAKTLVLSFYQYCEESQQENNLLYLFDNQLNHLIKLSVKSPLKSNRRIKQYS